MEENQEGCEEDKNLSMLRRWFTGKHLPLSLCLSAHVLLYDTYLETQ